LDRLAKVVTTVTPGTTYDLVQRIEGLLSVERGYGYEGLVQRIEGVVEH
jgi:hypothetical protein